MKESESSKWVTENIYLFRVKAADDNGRPDEAFLILFWGDSEGISTFLNRRGLDKGSVRPRKRLGPSSKQWVLIQRCNTMLKRICAKYQPHYILVLCTTLYLVCPISATDSIPMRGRNYGTLKGVLTPIQLRMWWESQLMQLLASKKATTETTTIRTYR